MGLHGGPNPDPETDLRLKPKSQTQTQLKMEMEMEIQNWNWKLRTLERATWAACKKAKRLELEGIFCFFFCLICWQPSKYDSVDDHVNEGQGPSKGKGKGITERATSRCWCLFSFLLIFIHFFFFFLEEARAHTYAKRQSVDAKSKDHTGSITTNDMERSDSRLENLDCRLADSTQEKMIRILESN